LLFDILRFRNKRAEDVFNVYFAILNIIFALSLRSQLLLSMQQGECPINYTVRTGDIIYNIANKFNSSVEEISSLNNITDPNFIRIGQTLKIPFKNLNYAHWGG
jgi:spore germination protein YaaH